MPFRKSNPWGQVKPPAGAQIDRGDPLSVGLIAYWLMNGGGGGSIYDAVRSNKATIASGNSWNVGQFGRALNFSGTTSNFDAVVDLLSQSPTNDFCSISAWFNTANVSQVGTMVAFGQLTNGAASNENVLLQVTTQIWALTQGGGNNQAVATIAAGVWTHACAVFTSSTSRSIYVNGRLIQTDTSAQAAAPTARKVRFGQRGTNDNQPYAGKLDNVRIYNRPLLSTEVLRLYREPFAGIVAPRRRIISSTATGIGFDAASNSGYQAAQSTYTFNRTVSGSNTFLAVDVAVLSAGQTVTSVVDDSAGGAVAMSFIGAQSTVTSFGRVEQWGLVNPATGTKSIAVTLSGVVISASTAVSYTGVHQTSPTEAFNSAQATNVGAADATVTITSVANNCWIHAAVATDDASITAGQTSRNNVTGAGGSGADEDTGPITPPGGTAMSYTNIGALSTWAIGGYAIRPVAAANLGGGGNGLLLSDARNFLVLR